MNCGVTSVYIAAIPIPDASVLTTSKTEVTLKLYYIKSTRGRLTNVGDCYVGIDWNSGGYPYKFYSGQAPHFDVDPLRLASKLSDYQRMKLLTDDFKVCEVEV